MCPTSQGHLSIDFRSAGVCLPWFLRKRKEYPIPSKEALYCAGTSHGGTGHHCLFLALINNYILHPVATKFNSTLNSLPIDECGDGV